MTHGHMELQHMASACCYQGFVCVEDGWFPSFPETKTMPRYKDRFVGLKLEAVFPKQTTIAEKASNKDMPAEEKKANCPAWWVHGRIVRRRLLTAYDGFPGGRPRRQILPSRFDSNGGLFWELP